jgi:hypothetical protein
MVNYLNANFLAQYGIRDEVAIEDFEEGSLVFLSEQLRLVHLNPVARDIVGWIDGKRTVHQVAEAVARKYKQPIKKVFSDVLELLTDLEVKGVIEYREEGTQQMR